MTYKVQTLIIDNWAPRFTIAEKGFKRRSDAWAWLIDFATENKYTIIDHDIDEENDAIDAMLTKNGIMYQYAIEREEGVSGNAFVQLLNIQCKL